MKENIYQTNEYAKKHPDYHVSDSFWKVKHIIKMIKKNKLDVQTVCDVGCGAGEVLYQIQKLLPPEVEYFGYDISPKAIELGKQRENEKLRFFCEGLLHKEVDPFDLLLCIDVFEHIEDYLGFLVDLRSKAKYKIFHIPLDMSMIMLVQAGTLVEVRRDWGHLHYFSKETAIASLEDAGYTIIDWFFLPMAIDMANKRLTATLLKWPRKLIARFNQGLAARMLGGVTLMVLAE